MARKAKNPGIGQGNHKGQEREFQCKECGSSFTARRSDALYCHPCRDKHKANHGANYDPTKFKCIDCGKVIDRHSKRCLSCRSKQFVGEKNSYWKGGRTNHRGYIRIKNPDPNGRPRYIGEHILVWEAVNGKVPTNWDVHHLNGIKDDNRLENLFAMSKSDHHSNHHQFYEARIRELEQQLREA